jgi:putative ABC transport system substrate-binding protein
VVQASGSSPVNTKLAASLARPGGMVTGVTNVFSEVSEKYLELLLAAAPTAKRVGFLVDSTTLISDYEERARRAAMQYSVEIRFAEATRVEDIDSVLARFAKEGVQALVLLPGGLFITERRRILKLALAQRWPVIGTVSFVENGALLGYSDDPVPRNRRAAWYVDRILKGTKPGDLPIEQPTKFELIVNMKTAKALGLTIPQPFLMRVDKVIE